MTKDDSHDSLMNRIDELLASGPAVDSARFIFTLTQNLILTVEHSILKGRIDRDFDAASSESVSQLLDYLSATLLLLSAMRQNAIAHTRSVPLGHLQGLSRSGANPQSSQLINHCLRESLQHGYRCALEEEDRYASSSAVDLKWCAHVHSALSLSAATCSMEALRIMTLGRLADDGTLEYDAVGDLLSISDTSIGILDALRSNVLRSNEDVESIARDMHSHLNSSRMECGGPIAQALMTGMVRRLIKMIQSALMLRVAGWSDA